MRSEVRITPLARVQATALRGRSLAAFQSFTAELAQGGCEAMGYRATGALVERLCVRHLRAAERVVVAFPEPDVATIVLIGRHTDDPNSNVYDLLYRVLGIEAPRAEKRTKPPCCDEDGSPPRADDEVVDALARRTRELLGVRRR